MVHHRHLLAGVMPSRFSATPSATSRWLRRPRGSLPEVLAPRAGDPPLIEAVCGAALLRAVAKRCSAHAAGHGLGCPCAAVPVGLQGLGTWAGSDQAFQIPWALTFLCEHWQPGRGVAGSPSAPAAKKLAKMREIVHIQGGQCGNQVRPYWPWSDSAIAAVLCLVACCAANQRPRRTSNFSPSCFTIARTDCRLRGVCRSAPSSGRLYGAVVYCPLLQSPRHTQTFSSVVGGKAWTDSYV